MKKRIVASGAGETPQGIFQFDVEDPDLDMYNRWLSNAFQDLVDECRTSEGLYELTVFEQGKTMFLDCQVWLEPGYYIPFKMVVTFSAQQKFYDGSREKTQTISCETRFNYPLDKGYYFEDTLRCSFGFFPYQQLTTVVMGVISQVGSILLNTEGVL